MSRNSAISVTIQPIATTIIRPCISSNCLIIKDSRITISIFTISDIICLRVWGFFIVFRLDEVILRDGCLEGGREREEGEKGKREDVEFEIVHAETKRGCIERV